MSYLEELLPEFRKGAKIRRKSWVTGIEGVCRKENYTFNAYDVDADDWEIVQDEPINWDYIIKNKCLCWFWDGINKKIINTLTWFEKGFSFPYKSSGGVKYQNCRPVRRDEVTFYEDRKDD